MEGIRPPALPRNQEKYFAAIGALIDWSHPAEWFDKGLCRVFDADSNELKRIKLGPSLSLEAEPVSLRLQAEGSPAARAKVTLLLEGTADGQKAPPKRSEADQK